MLSGAEVTRAAVNEEAFEILEADEDVALFLITSGKGPQKVAKGRLTLRRPRGAAGAGPARPFLHLCNASSGKLFLVGSIPKGTKPTAHASDATTFAVSAVGRPPASVSDDAVAPVSMSLLLKTSSAQKCAEFKAAILANCD